MGRSTCVDGWAMTGSTLDKSVLCSFCTSPRGVSSVYPQCSPEPPFVCKGVGTAMRHCMTLQGRTRQASVDVASSRALCLSWLQLGPARLQPQAAMQCQPQILGTWNTKLEKFGDTAASCRHGGLECCLICLIFLAALGLPVPSC